MAVKPNAAGGQGVHDPMLAGVAACEGDRGATAVPPPDRPASAELPASEAAPSSAKAPRSARARATDAAYPWRSERWGRAHVHAAIDELLASRAQKRPYDHNNVAARAQSYARMDESRARVNGEKGPLP